MVIVGQSNENEKKDKTKRSNHKDFQTRVEMRVSFGLELRVMMIALSEKRNPYRNFVHSTDLARA